MLNNTISFFSVFGRSVSRSLVEDSAQPVSAGPPAPSCCWIPGKLFGPSKVHPFAVGSYISHFPAAGDSYCPRLIGPLLWHFLLAALYGPAWTCCSPGSISTSAARTAAADRFAVTFPYTDPSTLPARLHSTYSSLDTEPYLKATWKKVKDIKQGHP